MRMVQLRNGKKVVEPNDMMNNPRSTHLIMHQAHWNSWNKYIKKYQLHLSNNPILNHFVETAP